MRGRDKKGVTGVLWKRTWKKVRRDTMKKKEDGLSGNSWESSKLAEIEKACEISVTVNDSFNCSGTQLQELRL